MSALLEHVLQAGYPFGAESVIHLFVGGSGLHGAKLEGTDDLDIYGVFMEPPERVLGLHPHEHFVHSTSGNEHRNGPEDIDITLYSLRKWAFLACKGNPTALHFLWSINMAPRLDVWNLAILPARTLFLSRRSAAHFFGFVDSQMGRLLGTRGRGKKGQRPELEAEFGYDVKAGMHAVRLMCELKELLSTGTITQPRPEAQLLKTIRQGAWSLDKLCTEVSKLRMDCEALETVSVLPPKVNEATVSKLLANCYLKFWAAETP